MTDCAMRKPTADDLRALLREYLNAKVAHDAARLAFNEGDADDPSREPAYLRAYDRLDAVSERLGNAVLAVHGLAHAEDERRAVLIDGYVLASFAGIVRDEPGEGAEHGLLVIEPGEALAL